MEPPAEATPRIPVNLITGFLGVGKSTAIMDLLRRKPGRERWAVLVNEYGEVGIDGAMIEGEVGDLGVTVREVAGGCVCCTTAPYLPVALHMLMQDGRPDRILVETSGLGHPARLLDMLRGPNYRDRLEVRATLGLVAPADFTCPGMFDNVVFMDQVHLSDVLILNKRDQVNDDVLGRFQSWAEALFPPKLLIAATSRGILDPAWLDLTAQHERLPLYPEAHVHHEMQTTVLHRPPQPGRPVRYESPPGVRPACGWIFHPEDIFEEDGLLALLERHPEIHRAKGIFRLPDEWIALNRSHQELTVKHTAYRRDSRVELFCDRPDWNALDSELRDCLREDSSHE